MPYHLRVELLATKSDKEKIKDIISDGKKKNDELRDRYLDGVVNNMRWEGNLVYGRPDLSTPFSSDDNKKPTKECEYCKFEKAIGAVERSYHNHYPTPPTPPVSEEMCKYCGFTYPSHHIDCRESSMRKLNKPVERVSEDIADYAKDRELIFKQFDQIWSVLYPPEDVSEDKTVEGKIERTKKIDPVRVLSNRIVVEFNANQIVDRYIYESVCDLGRKLNELINAFNHLSPNAKTK